MRQQRGSQSTTESGIYATTPHAAQSRHTKMLAKVVEPLVEHHGCTQQVTPARLHMGRTSAQPRPSARTPWSSTVLLMMPDSTRCAHCN